jgi:hypothetical protein
MTPRVAHNFQPSTFTPTRLCFNSIDVKEYIDKNIGWCLTLVEVYSLQYSYIVHIVNDIKQYK